MTEEQIQAMRTRFMGDLAVIALALRQYRSDAPDDVDQAVWLMCGLFRAALQSDQVVKNLYDLAFEVPGDRGLN